jgi:hypothetical protein
LSEKHDASSHVDVAEIRHAARIQSLIFFLLGLLPTIAKVCGAGIAACSLSAGDFMSITQLAAHRHVFSWKWLSIALLLVLLGLIMSELSSRPTPLPQHERDTTPRMSGERQTATHSASA